MKSIFTDKQRQPGQADLKAALGETFTRWESLRKYVIQNFPAVTEHWHFSGDKYEWSSRASDTKSTRVYFLPRDKCFKVAFVFGQKATDRVLAGNIADSVKKELEATKVCRGTRYPDQNRRTPPWLYRGTDQDQDRQLTNFVSLDTL